ncbi:glucokinase [Pseudogymnoascus verrucosus]|uniref:Phosphotransferase n=1 Tax=Pseudogymnoascus verrucosus TaxID=342668 RepID=A0A1B8GMQ2_9PEZI|nr:glucokinase [Pseudogymnoascus verrucosus]OBT97113.1 glucokinase [Pseudogymnoascus verrucosus]
MSIHDHADRVAAEFEYDGEHVREAVKHFIRQMHEGLRADGGAMAQIPTYVTTVPDGTEKGLYLALDLGGTNVRVCSVDLHGDTKLTTVQSKTAIPPELMHAATFRELLHFLAQQIELFLQTYHDDLLQAHRARTTETSRDALLKLGFTFSFAFKQLALNRGTLLYWTKGFNIPDAIGQELCGLLQDELDALNVPVLVAALVNDTVGTLVARSYQSPGATTTLLGAIFGTGTNGAYVEKLDNITKMLPAQVDGSAAPIPSGDMILNTEWGSFDPELSILPNTPYDIAVDRESVHPGIQMFEKRVSGLFLGETLRHALLAIAPYSETMVIPLNSPIHDQYSISTTFISSAASDESPTLEIVRSELKRMLNLDATPQDAEAVKKLVLAINKRAARLAGVAIAAIVVNSGRLTDVSTPPASPLSVVDGKVPLPISLKAVETESDEAISDVHSKSKLHISPYRRLQSLLRRIFCAANPNLTTPESDLPPSKPQTPPIRPVVQNEGIIDIGVDGSIIEFCPGFISSIRSALRDVDEIGVEGDRRIRIGIAKDGSGIGAALIARMAELEMGRGVKG